MGPSRGADHDVGVQLPAGSKNSFQNEDQLPVADEGAGQLKQPEVEVGPAFVADAEPLEGVQPGEAALDHPALAAQPGAVGHAPAGDPRGDPASPQSAAVNVEVVAPVGEQLAWAAAGPATPSADGWHGVKQRHQLSDVVAVAAGQRDRERDAAGVADQMVLGARPAAVDRRRADVVPPLRARMCEPSTAQRSRSSSPSARS